MAAAADGKQVDARNIFKVLQRLLRNPDSTEFVYARPRARAARLRVPISARVRWAALARIDVVYRRDRPVAAARARVLD
jgi:hypothetical protein